MDGKSGQAAQRTKIKREPDVAPFPYARFEGEPLWEAVEAAIAALVENGDLTENTARRYLVGFIVKSIRESARE